MRKILLIFISILAATFNVVADTDVDLTEIPEDSKPDNGENPGRRTAPTPIRCVIDFAAHAIVGSSPKLDAVSDYELWSADGSMCIFMSSDEAQFVMALSELLPGEYLLILKADTYSLRGYLLL